MKTFTKQFKSILLILVLLLSFNIYAQKTPKKNNIFVRVYNLEGKKINKGYVVVVTDTSLQLQGHKATKKIQVSDIGLIKTKHSEGHNVLMGAAIGGSTMAILGAATSDPNAFLGYSASEGAAGGAILGGTADAAVGGVTILFKKSKSYIINGDIIKWKVFQEMVKNKVE